MSPNRRKRRSPEQIIRHLREADGMLSAGQSIASGLPEAGGVRADVSSLAE